MSRSRIGNCRRALLLAAIVIVLPGCARRFGGPWPFGADQTEHLKTYGPVGAQRVDELKTRAKKVSQASPQEQEAFATELAQNMKNETDVLVRIAMIDVLSQIRTPTADAVLYAGLRDPEVDIRVACCEAWQTRPHPETTRILAETLGSDTNLDVRLAAARALASAEDKEAVKALGRALEDNDPAMQYVAVASMKSVTGKDLGNNVDDWRQLAKQPDPPLREKSLAAKLRQWF
ncbi:MAG: HEAT repeat domain-containing protein [Pirellulales bacterium]|nr:HEAT repeat domain-containing protein [Pirellulales bacterium]